MHTRRAAGSGEAEPRKQATAWLGRLLPEHFPIAYKLALIITLVITVGMSLLGTVILGNQTRLLQQQINHFGSTIVQQMSEEVKEPLLALDTLELKMIVANMLNHERVMGAAIFNDEQLALAEDGLVPAASLRDRLQQPVGSSTVTALYWHSGSLNDTEVISFIAPIVFRELTIGYGLVTFDRSQMGVAQRDALRAIVTATVLMVLLGAAAALLLGKRLSRPIHRLMDASREISRGNYSFRFSDRRNDEIGTLMASFNTMSEGLLRKEQVEQTFSRYVSPKVAKEVLSDLEQIKLGGRHVEATVLFADIVGFTQLSEKLAPHEVNALLNEYFGLIARAAQPFHGHIDKFMGDCAMLVFGVPEADPDHSFHAVSCAILIQHLVEGLNTRRLQADQPSVQFRIGINTGSMLAGNMGYEERMEYTVVGDAVNLASRLSTVAGAGEIIITQEMHDMPQLQGRLISERYGTIRLRGKSEPVSTYRIFDLAQEVRTPLEGALQNLLQTAGAP